MATITANCLVILDADPEGDADVARKLRDHLRDIIDFGGQPTPGLMTYRVLTPQSLQDALADVLNRARTDGMRPVIHFSGHGWEDGVETASREPVGWTALKSWLTDINVQLCHGLLVVFGSCEGATFTKSLRLEDRAPVWGIVGATQIVNVGQVLNDYGNFYSAMFRGDPMTTMLEALRRDAPASLYYAMSAEQFFLDVWRGYRKTYLSEPELSQRVRKLRREAAGAFDRLGKSEIVELLIAREQPLFDQARATYFMHDLCPDNATLYCPQYSDV